MRRVRMLRHEEGDEANFDVGPLLDMVFILLIFFVVTTTFNKESAVKVKRPRAESAETVIERSVTVTVTKEGAFYIEGQAIDDAILEGVFEKMRLRRGDVRVVVVADDYSYTGKVVRVLDACAKAGIEDVAVAADMR